jgi:hypothetical protein
MFGPYAPQALIFGFGLFFVFMLAKPFLLRAAVRKQAQAQADLHAELIAKAMAGAWAAPAKRLAPDTDLTKMFGIEFVPPSPSAPAAAALDWTDWMSRIAIGLGVTVAIVIVLFGVAVFSVRYDPSMNPPQPARTEVLAPKPEVAQPAATATTAPYAALAVQPQPQAQRDADVALRAMVARQKLTPHH